MNWKATGWTLLAIGIGIAVAGFVWADHLQGTARKCHFRLGSENCPTNTPGLILAGIGGGVALIAVALLVGALSQPPSDS